MLYLAILKIQNCFLRCSSINQFDFLKEEPANDKLSSLKKAVIWESGSVYNVVLLAGTIISLLMFIVTGLILVLNKDRENGKNKLYSLCFVMCVVFGATFIVSAGITIGKAW